MKNIILLLFVLAASRPIGAATGGPDAFGYRWIDSDETAGPVYSWTEIRGLGASPGAADDKSWLAALPQSFRFYGQVYDSVYICSNGFLSFASRDSNPYPSSIPNSTLPNAMAAPLWNDLDPADPQSGGIYCYHDSAAGRFMVEWDSVVHFGTQHYYSIQAILDLADSSITFLYCSAQPGWQADFASIGIENSAGTVGLSLAQSFLKDQYAVRFYNQQDSHDLQAAAIVSPGWYLDPEDLAVPELLAQNTGLVSQTFPVVCHILCNDTLIRVDTAYVTELPAGDSLAVGFAPWQAGPAGERYVFRMFCDLDGDQNRANDTLQSEAISFPYRNKINASWRSAAISVDGVLSNGEWPDAAKIDITDILSRNGQAVPAGSAFLYAVNDSSALYLAVDVPWDASLESGDALYLFVDDDGDGAWAGDNSEGRYILQQSGAADSLTFTALPAVINSGAGGIAKAIGIASGHAQYEMSIPLGGGTGSYIRNGPGGIAKLHLSWQDGADKNIYAWWPQDMELPQDENPAHYGRLALADASGVAEQPQETALSPGIFRLWNSPNPFAAQTRISYQLPAAGPVEIVVYNIMGQRVAGLVDGVRSAGPHSVTWTTATSCATGVYLCRLSFAGRHRVVRMQLIK
ncbi:MAG: T9SS type A sorting domain-containing protein [Candidatus Edwardsbacteria bacterium]|nr:T9SS type A sorting domain-containing protein [Candidatus Edwardsbacteria bacterium]MBU1576481.1 T9SS type A sorting domain-containing protein [Candidatus Edwardsbacteria bacterium]MBU2464460.1 T9SS type A sorting domain-containing protein [Candidatus Edwardsbacteria bacterium]MBU2594554.1 T9SS type A sorting domain-containing protein [Candidatus Edwardsbacteria bacterium]